MTEHDELRKKKLGQVQGLLDKAASTTFPEERDALVAKADEIMAAYAIEMFELNMGDKNRGAVKPELRAINRFRSVNAEWQVVEALDNIFFGLSRLIGCRVVYDASNYKVVGWPSDLDYLEMLFLNVQVHLMSSVDPKPTKDLSFEDNLALLKESGMKWKEIHRRLVEAGVMPDEPFTRPIGVRFTKVYTDHCKQNGRERIYDDPKVWRREFIIGYSQRIEARIAEMRNARDEAGRGHELTLVSMKEALTEFYYECFPQFRPHPDTCDCETCHATKCRTPNCPRSVCVAMRKPVKYRRAPQPRDLATSAAARRAGSRSANGADLSGGNKVTGTNREIN